MKLCIKKIYCDSCQKLFKCREQEAGSGTQILCSKVKASSQSLV
jgi:hypothetical protein